MAPRRRGSSAGSAGSSGSSSSDASSSSWGFGGAAARAAQAPLGMLEKLGKLPWARMGSAARQAAWLAWQHLPAVLVALLALRVLALRRSQAFPAPRRAIVGYERGGQVAVLHNHMRLFKNGTGVFYNGTVVLPNGTVVHTRELSYEDAAECSAQRLSFATERALEAYLENRPGLLAGGEAGKYCGFESATHFATWSGMTSSGAPVLFPEDDAQAIEFVRRIGDAGCKVRPVGASHSESGITLGSFDDRSVGVSLARYRAPPGSGWALNETTMLADGRVRAEAGRTLLRVQSMTRPEGWFLPVQPANWATTVGGAVCSLVDGGGFGETFLSAHVTRLRVLLGDGRILEVSEEQELTMWRNSMGLIGLVLGAEIQLERREGFAMGLRQTVLHQWNPWYLDAAVAALLPGADGAQYLFDPWTDGLAGVGFVKQRPSAGVWGSRHRPRFASDDECTFDVRRMACNFADLCEFRYRLGDLTPAQSCRLRRKADALAQDTRATYAELDALMEHAAEHGLPTPEHDSAQRWWDGAVDVESAMHYSSEADEPDGGAEAGAWTDNLARAVNEARERLNDGFWMIGAPKSLSLCYYFPVSAIFKALDIHRALVRDLVIKRAPFQFRDAPVRFSFVRMAPKQVLQPGALLSGDYVRIEVVVHMPSAEDGGSGAGSPRQDQDQGWRFAIAELERRWLHAFAGEPIFPHLGHVHGLHVFSPRNASRFETVLASYRRARRVREAFARTKERFEAQFERPRRGLFGIFDGGYAPVYEDVVRGAFDPSRLMLARAQQELYEPQADTTHQDLEALHKRAEAAAEAEEEYFGDLQNELLHEAYVDAGASKLLPSVPVPFAKPEVLRGVFGRAQAVAFLRYRQRLDPDNRFWGGGATRYFAKAWKREASGPDDPDQLEEDRLVLRIKAVAAQADDQDFFGAGLRKLLGVAAAAAALYMWDRWRRPRRRRRRRASTSSTGSSAGTSELSSSELSSSESDY